MTADKVIAKAKKIAAHALEAAEDDIEFADAAFPVVGTDRAVSLQEVGQAADVPSRLPPGLDNRALRGRELLARDPEFPQWLPCLRSRDRSQDRRHQDAALRRGRRCRHRHQQADIKGQIHGGVAQGIGQAFTEHLVYDRPSGQLLTGSLMDYGLPRADEVPFFETDENPVPTQTNPLGVKGAGEAGNVGALAAIMNAVADALSPLAITHIDMPASPERVWRAMRAAPSGVPGAPSM